MVDEEKRLSGIILDLKPRLYAKLNAEQRKKEEKILLSLRRQCRKSLLIISTVNPFNLDKATKQKAGKTALHMLCMESLVRIFLSCLRKDLPVPEELVKVWEQFIEDELA